MAWICSSAAARTVQRNERKIKSRKVFILGIVLGIIWGFWHLPLWLNSGFTGLNLLLYCLLFLIAITSLSVMMTWIFCRTVKSLIPMTISHFSFNASFMLIGSYIPTLSFFAIMAALLFLTVVILWISGGMTRV